MRKLFVILSLLVIYNVSYPQLGYKYHEKFISLNVKDSSICFIKTKTNINELGDNIASKCHKIMDDNHYIVHRTVIEEIKGIEYFSEIYTNTRGNHIIILPRIIFRIKVPESFDIDVLGKYDKIEIENRDSDVYILRCSAKSSEELLGIVSAISNEEWALWCEPEMLSNIELNNPLYSQQYYLKNTGQNGGLSGIDINVEPAWNISNGSGVVVAVIDEGVDDNHEDLQGKVLSGYTACVPTGVGEPMNASSTFTRAHGIECAGIIAANDNTIGIKGVAYNSQILPINICSQTPIPPYYSGFVSNCQIAQAINWAYPRADVLSNSWGGGAESNYLALSIENARTYGRNGLGSIVVFASGNNSVNPNSVSYPADIDGVVTVGAIDKQGVIWNYSCRGPSMDLVAPSGNIGGAGDVVTTDRMGSLGDDSGNYVYTFGGTSAACPQVAGVASLMISANPNLTEQQVVDILRSTARDMGAVGFDNTYGYGLVDAHAAVMEAYFYDRQILGSNIISPCSIAYPCDGIITYNLNSSSMPSNTTVQWSVTGNLSRISSNNQSISVQPTGIGTGTITISYTHEGYTVTRQKQITIESLPPSSNYYCNYSTTGNMTFNNELYINGTFTINNGHVVTISCIGQCLPDAKIIVQPGGKLVVDGGTISNYCTGKTWNAIYVVGNTYQRQLAQYQGTLEIKNNSVIENSSWGIVTWDGTSYSTTGGIVKCENSTFLNNGRNVEFYSYTNHDANNNECDNVSYLKNCNFTIDDNNLFSSSGVTYTDMIKMSVIKGIKIRGCHFSDNRTGSPTRGNAIRLAGGGVNIKPSCSVGDYTLNMPCNCTGESSNTFYGFAKGIYAGNTGTNYPFYVFKTDFEKCKQSIYSSAVNNYEITMSNINLTGSQSLSPADSYGIYSSSCTGYKIEGNSIYTTNTTPVFCPTIGIYMYNSGVDNIHKNTFEKLDRGIFSNNNPGLLISCNVFSNIFNNDIETTGFVCHQGSSSTGAGNQFTSGILNLKTDNTNYPTYYFSGQANSSNPYYPASVSGSITRMISNAAHACLSTICGFTIIIDPILGNSAPDNDDVTIYEALQQMYDSRIAEYNAAGYGFLLENFEDEDADVVALARQKQDTLISLGRTMAEIANRNIEAIFKDTVVFDREALNGWYNRINTTTAKYSLVNSYFEVGEYDLARQELAMIPQRFALNTDELAEYDNFCQYESLRESVYASGRNYAQLTEDEIAELQVIVERNTGVSSAYANSVLCFFYGICRDEEIDIDFDIDAPMNSKSTTEVVEENAEPLAIYVYPNPADEELNILLNSLPEGKTMIEFHDVTGRLVLSEEIKSANTSINISSLKQGVYMYRIVNGDNVIARDRIVKE